jgi:hypothetical protein
MTVYTATRSLRDDNGTFHSWVDSTDEALWDAFRERKQVIVAMEDCTRLGVGVPDQLDGQGVRIAGTETRELGPVSRWLLRFALRVGA